ncbi:MAG: hypothetical protein K1X94_31145 [Sandaracinaceae bacterium]|nr:hypothetical protein [Sandaracinaceae bacterium]
MDARAQEVLSVACAIRDPAMASGYLRSVLHANDVEDVCDLVTVVHAASLARDARAGEVWLLLAIVLADVAENELADTIARRLRRRGLVELADMMVGVPSTDEVTGRVPDFGKGRPLSLGERKSVARTRDRSLLARVLRDPHPDVIRILLGNPHLTEPDVVRLVAQRPIQAEVLREVCCSPRWLVRHGVRVALAKNPHLPVPLALRLVPQLSATEQRAIVNSPELDARLRDACAAALEPRTLH